MDRDELRLRTIDRGRAVWSDMDLDGITTGDETVESQINQLGKDGVRGMVVIMDAAAEEAAANRDKLYRMELAGVEQERRLAYEKIVAQRQVLAFKTAGDLLMVAAREYDAEIARLIMAARQVAEEMGRSKVTVAEQRALMDEKKQVAKLAETNAAISVELLNQQQVQVDIAKARLDAAKAVVKVLTAETEVQQTQLRVVQSGLDLVLTEVESATLLADIAGIYADIVTRGLAAIKYEVERAEIEQASQAVAQKLADMLAIWSRRTELEQIRTQYESLFQIQNQMQHEHAKTAEDLAQYNQDLQESVFAAERSVADAHQDCELAMKAVLEAKKRYTKQVEKDGDLAAFKANQSMETVMQMAHSYVQQYTKYYDVSQTNIGRVISEGSYLTGGSVPRPSGSPGSSVEVPSLSRFPDATMPECE